MELKRHSQPPVQPRPVNDVLPPAPPQATQPSPTPADDSLDAILVHEQANEAHLAPQAEHKPDAEKDNSPSDHKHDDKKHAAKPKPEKIKASLPAKQHTGLGGVIFAAVVIILGLGAMFTYAYLRSQNIAVF
jgi:hypothetical protein